MTTRVRAPALIVAAILAGVVLAMGTRVVLTAPDTALPWAAAGSGGGNSSSASYSLGTTLGQPLVGSGTSSGYSLGVGYVYGVASPDQDGDGTADFNDNCLMVPNANQANTDGDEYGDACEQPQCVTVINHWAVPAGDADCDGYPSSAAASGKAPESFVGTDAADKCSNTPAANDEALPDAWPVDFNDDQKATIIDISFYSSRFGAIGPNPPYAVRYDLNADNRLSIIDVSQYGAFFGKLCAP